MSDSTVFSSLINDIQTQADTTSAMVENLTQTLSDQKTSSDGLSFLELKNLLLTDYLTDLTYLMLRKTFGKSIEGEPCLERLVENRTVMEKMRPVEKKLKYQIDKYSKIADNGSVPANDPLHFKPNLEAFDVDENDSDSESLDDHEGGAKAKKYVAPKHVPAFFDEDSTLMEKDENAKLQRRMLSRGLIEDLKKQHLETPEEIFDMETYRQSRQAAKEREKIRFEEDNFMRLPISKKDRQDRRKRSAAMTIGRLGDEVTHDFGRSNFETDNTPGSRKKRKHSGRGAKKGSKRKIKKY